MQVDLIVDQLGQLKAQIADLSERAEALRQELIKKADGDGLFQGALFRATVTHSERAVIDMDAVRAAMSPQWLTAHTTYVPSVTVRVVARTSAMSRVA